MKKVLFVIFFALLFCPIFVSAIDKVEINTATLEQLDEIIGIGPALGQRIIDGRPYSSIDDLIRVNGIGEKTLQKIKDQGLACVNCTTTQSNEETRSPEPAVGAGETAVSSSGEIGSLISYPAGVVINEIMPSPEGPDEKNEWIEIYNQNDFEVDLSGWKIEDIEGTKTKYVFPDNTKISGYGYLLFKRPETKITLNNSKDGLNLFWPNDEVVSSIKYSNAPIKQSYSQTTSGWQWSATSTPGSKNIVQSLSNLEKSGNSNKIEAETAAVSQSLNDVINPDRNFVSNRTSPWFLFFTALATTTVSAAIVLFIKLKINKNNVRT